MRSMVKTSKVEVRELDMAFEDEVANAADKDRARMERIQFLSDIRESLEAARRCFVDDVSRGSGDPSPYSFDDVSRITFLWELRRLREES